MPYTQGGIYLGLDPGNGGGLAALTKTNVHLESWWGMTVPNIWTTIKEWSESALFRDDRSIYAILEKVGGYISPSSPENSAGGGDKVKSPPQLASRMGVLCQSFGQLQMALIASGIPHEEVHPKKWQKEFSLSRHKGEPNAQWKGRIRQKAQQLFPHMKISLATADALLMAEWCRRQWE